jgi:hypothetical protein
MITSASAEDDTTISIEVKLPILQDFYRHIYNPHWHYSCMYESLRTRSCYYVVHVGLIMFGLQVEQTTTKF